MADLELQMTPMIDCVFLLLIYFMSITVYNDQEKIAVQLPSAQVSKNPETAPQQVKISVTPDGSIHMGGAVVTPDELTASILKAKEEGTYTEIPVTIRADQDVKHKFVVPVLVALSRAGVWDVSIASKKK